jgi:hypothetical protein
VLTVHGTTASNGQNNNRRDDEPSCNTIAGNGRNLLAHSNCFVPSTRHHRTLTWPTPPAR